MGREIFRVVEVIDLENGGNLLPTRMKIPCRGSVKKQVVDLSDEDEDNDQVLEIKPIDFKGQWTEILSEEPKASMLHNFLSKKECKHLINLGKPHLRRSLVSGGSQGIISSSRTSYGTFLERGGDKIIRDIEKRIADYTNVPIENGEGLQILRYEVGQTFKPHYDYSDDASYIKTKGPRMATVLMYLSDVEEGGETVFPLAKGKIASAPDSSMTNQNVTKKGLSVKPKMGDALLFWSMKPDGTRDPLSYHGGSPVIKGNKWSCTKWLHSKIF